MANYYRILTIKNPLKNNKSIKRNKLYKNKIFVIQALGKKYFFLIEIVICHSISHCYLSLPVLKMLINGKPVHWLQANANRFSLFSCAPQRSK